MPMNLRRNLVAALAGAAALAGGCIRDNVDHCFYKDAGFCAQAHPGRAYCSICDGELDGCVEAPPSKECAAESLASATEVESTTSSTATTDTTVDATTDMSSTASTTDTTSTASTTDMTSTTSTTDMTSTASTTEMTTGPMTTGGPMCGDGKAEAPEVCDGADLNDHDCTETMEWGGGTLQCAPNCMSLDYSLCCLGVGMECNQLNDECCDGSTCKMDGLLMYKCLAN